MAQKPQTASNDTDQELTGVEIFRAGTYQIVNAAGDKTKVVYSAKDVAQMAENGNELLADHKYEVPAKLGHSEKQTTLAETGLPAAGWVKRFYTKGEKLVADFKQVPAKLAEAIKRGRYKYVSSEIYDPEDTDRNFGEFGIKGFTLRAVAFLGADIPVVKGLNPLMLAAGADGAVTITIPVEEKQMKVFSEEKGGKLMVPANRYNYGTMVKHSDSDEVHSVHAVHGDGTYDTHELHNPDKVKKAVHHDNLTLLSEAEYKKTVNKEKEMDPSKLAELEKSNATVNAALTAERAKNKELMEKQRDEKISAFAEKHKVFGLTAALKPAFEAVAKLDVPAPVKLAEGKEMPFVDALLAFAEGLIGAKKVILGEAAPAGKDTEAPKEASVKLAEAPYKAYSEQMKVEISGAERAVKAREYAEQHKVSIREALLAVAALEQEEK